MLLTLEKVSASTRAIADTDGTESTSAGSGQAARGVVGDGAAGGDHAHARLGARPRSGHAQATAMSAPPTRRARVVPGDVTTRL